MQKNLGTMNMNTKEIETYFWFDGNKYPLDAGGFRAHPEFGLDERGRKDYDNFKYFSVAASGQPLYIKEGDSWNLVKTKEKMLEIIDNFPMISYNSVILKLND